jgi:hypothetical protein
MYTISLLLYAIFFVVVLLMVTPSIVACYRYWFSGGKLLSERLDAHFRFLPTASVNRGRKISKKDSGLSRIQSKSITNQSPRSIQAYDSAERR